MNYSFQFQWTEFTSTPNMIFLDGILRFATKYFEIFQIVQHRLGFCKRVCILIAHLQNSPIEISGTFVYYHYRSEILLTSLVPTTMHCGTINNSWYSKW